jgi:hypothetical protein
LGNLVPDLEHGALTVEDELGFRFTEQTLRPPAESDRRIRWIDRNELNEKPQMNRLIKLSIATSALAAALLFPGGAPAFQAKDASSKPAKAETPAPSDQEIADAKAKGLAWVNTSTQGVSQGRRVLRKD